MVVLAVENMPEGEKGEISKWLIEAKAGVFVGNVNALIREKIWQKVEDSKSMETSALMVYSDNTEQGYSMKMTGTPRRYIVDFEGLSFVATKMEG
ncbi:MAG: type I-E CRISPR-associated endoribonuclease Cas2e [Clostridia bacterium]|nr:type I-E CRISPR-associated endoribonuclease Cas2e [Clostridia bacterium]